MKVKRYTAPDVAQALRRVRRELGAGAVILSTSRLPSGEAEVTVGVEPEAGGEAKAMAAAAPAPPAHAGASPGMAAASEPASNAAMSALARRVDQLGRVVTRHLVVSEAAADFGARPEVAPLHHHLTRQEVEPEIIVNLLEGLNAPQGHGLLPRLSIRLKKLISVAPPVKLSSSGPVAMALVGPTGVGKTTTVAKLAASYSLQHRLKVGMITVDTFRVAAAEQLMVYGRIMEVPTCVASTSAELAEALETMADRDLVLVDTVGRSPADEESLAELDGILGGVEGLDCHLVLAAPTRDRDQEEVVGAFGRFGPKSIIFTKLDETSTYGPLLNRMVRHGLPVSWLTTGQKVPDDLEEATRDGLARRLLPRRGRLD